MTTLEFGLYENPILIEKFIVLMLKITPFCPPPLFPFACSDERQTLISKTNKTLLTGNEL